MARQDSLGQSANRYIYTVIEFLIVRIIGLIE